MNEVDEKDAGENAKRAARAGAALDAYAAVADADDAAALTDLLADLMHHADRAGKDFDAALDSARTHYTAELDEDE